MRNCKSDLIILSMMAVLTIGTAVGAIGDHMVPFNATYILTSTLISAGFNPTISDNNSTLYVSLDGAEDDIEFIVSAVVGSMSMKPIVLSIDNNTVVISKDQLSVARTWDGKEKVTESIVKQITKMSDSKNPAMHTDNILGDTTEGGRFKQDYVGPVGGDQTAKPSGIVP